MKIYSLRLLSLGMTLFFSILKSSLISHPAEIEELSEEIWRVYREIYESNSSLNTSLPLLPAPFHNTASLAQFTKMSKKQKNKCCALTESPPWSQGNTEKIQEYYRLHQERQLDRNLGRIATYFVGAIIHGQMDQEQLALALDEFDIHRLLYFGPYENSILSEEAQKLIYESLSGVDRVIDVHLHNMGYDEGNYLNPTIASQELASWNGYLSFLVLRYAAGMSSPIGSTQEARERMHLYVGHFPKLCGFVLPIQPAIWPNGKEDWDKTGSFLINQAAQLTAATFNPRDSALLPAVSIHPFDLQWKKKMQSAHAKGIRLIKWIPPQSIPPDSELLNEYYKMMKQLGMVLIAHSGPEHAVPINETNSSWVDFGNPLRFRKPLSMGVNVILAHSGHADKIPDLDDPNHSEVYGYELFIRLARQAHQMNLRGQWKGKLYGDLAAITTHYGTEIIEALLKCANEDGFRFIYGTDYPYTNLIQPKKDAYELAAAHHLLDVKKVLPLKEIRAWNPLLANYVFTRNLEIRTVDGEILRFPEECFTGHFKEGELTLIDQEQWNRTKVQLQN